MFDPVEAVREFIRHPSISTDSRAEAGMRGAREHISGLLAGMGLAVETVPTAKHPIVLARREGPAEWPHVLIYGHYDVQPADPLELWSTPPFDPVVQDGRLFGRGAADNKGPMMVHIAAAARLLEAQPDLPLRLTFLIEGEEEIGSPSFATFLSKQAHRLKGDFVLLSDTMSPSTEQLAITTGLRGIICLDVVVEGPRSDLHSGIFGGAVANPATVLARLCATLHNADGQVNVPGFYDGVTSPEAWERAELAHLDESEAAMAARLGVPSLPLHPGYTALEATRFWPTLEINGMGGGYQGEGSKTIIPSRAFAKISCRLVAGQDPKAVEAAVIATLKDRCPPTVRLHIEPGHSGPPYRVVPPDRSDTPADQSPVLARAFRAADDAVRAAFGNAPLYLREGGSVPIIGDLQRVLGMDSIMLGMFTPEDNLHAPNESFDLGMFAKGIDVSEAILRAVAKA
ncbi:MAG: M20/M25/M40 family metallo-hydrolase [Opitutales bacterium]|nr:M20/M25/M40 family metallo-hydrolase [Opitutales bacterium]